MAWGVRMTSSPSVFGSLTANSEAWAYSSAPASPMMSTGLLWLQVGGRILFRAAIVSGVRFASCAPLVMRASVASTPGPPALVTMARRGPFGRGCLASTSAMSNSSEMVSTRRTPTRWKAACNTSSLPVSEPVWEAAALAACSVRPGLITMIGLVSETSRAADRNPRASPMVSM